MGEEAFLEALLWGRRIGDEGQGQRGFEHHGDEMREGLW